MLEVRKSRRAVRVERLFSSVVEAVATVLRAEPDLETAEDESARVIRFEGVATGLDEDAALGAGDAVDHRRAS
jgi:hypothetical protein